MGFCSIDAALAQIRGGGMIILCDDEDRENEGDLVLPAQLVTPEAITFMAEQARTLISLAMSPQRCDLLQLALMNGVPGDAYSTAFTVSIEAAQGVTTGSSAHDRAHTIRTAVAFDAKPSDLVRPGHVFPLRAAAGGVLNRAGHTEAGCDLAGLAGFEPAAIISEIQLSDGKMARLADLEKLSEQHGLPIATIASVIEHRCQSESLIKSIGRARVRTAHGEFETCTYTDEIGGGPHVAFIHGSLGADDPPLVRVLAEPGVLDILDLDSQQRSFSAAAAFEMIVRGKSGVVLLLKTAGSAAAAAEPMGGSNAVRTYGIGAQILRDLGITRMRLLSSPVRLPSLEGYGLEVVETISRDG